MDDPQSIRALREQVSNMASLFVLAMIMADRRDERQILDLAVTSVAAVAACRPVATCLAVEDMLLRSPDGNPLDRPELSARLVELGDTEGAVDSPGDGWARAYPLRAIGGHAGFLVVAADAEPPQDRLFLLRTLAQQTGVALTSAALFHREQSGSVELRRVNGELADVNVRLAASVVDLQRRRKVHETLTAVAASGDGEIGIAKALHQLTGLAVAVEDRFGNLRSWAGPDQPRRYPRPSTRQQAELLAEVRRSPRPVRRRDRVIAVAQPRDEVLGVLTMIDPDRHVGDFELFALEHGAVVLAMELAHRRSLDEAELRLRRDLVDDLLAGTDDESALSRSQAFGHDLRTPHRVLTIQWSGSAGEAALIEAIERAARKVLDAAALLARRSDCIVAVAPVPAAWAGAHRWDELHQAVAGSLRFTAGAIGVGGLCRSPSEIPRSYAEAERALKIRLRSAKRDGVTVFDELGIYRLLALGEDDREVQAFVREWLGALLDYDEANGSELVMTLWQYYECGGNYDATARALLVHRSTLRYRLRRIRELTGHDLGAVDNKLNLHVATRAWQILRG
jgi:DNA-binding PucR family transcriptional regulator